MFQNMTLTVLYVSYTLKDLEEVVVPAADGVRDRALPAIGVHHAALLCPDARLAGGSDF